MTPMTTVWHYILTLGTYPSPASTDLRMSTFSGTLLATADAGRNEVYDQLRTALTAEHPALGLDNAVVVHSDIQPNTPRK
ncbi:hypothetical protein ACFCV8_00945 [Streptomyces sp. NPDC056347]|uniref:hypothetical protein n=1 Tax=Streptomyces sp. NPDC056347 TaxID=3345790 RepID=UPI0035DF5F24